MCRTDDPHLNHPAKQRQADEHKAGFAEYVRLVLMALVIVASLTGWWRHWMSRDWLAFAATLIGGFPIYEEAWENLRKRRMTMELSMTIALVAALCIGQFLTALVIAFFVLFAEMLEGYTVGSGRRAIESLIDALPRRVRVRRGGEEHELGTERSCRRRDHHHSAWRAHSCRRRGEQRPQFRGSIFDHRRIVAG